MEIKETLKDSFAIANLKINTASLLIELKRYQEAEVQIKENISYTRKTQKIGDLWHNLINLANLKREQKSYKEARMVASESMELAKKLESVKRMAETYFLQSLIEEGDSNFALALDYQRKGGELKQEFLNEESSLQIDQLREEFNAEQREIKNTLLNDKLNIEQQKQLYFAVGIALLAVLLGVIGFGWNKNRQKNEALLQQNGLINQQKDKLTELNDEKNSLISIVSHDLRTPFNAISLYQKNLIDNLNKSPLKVAESLEAIDKMTTYGQNLINDILDIEQIEINAHIIELLEFSLEDLCKELVKDFSPSINAKEIEVIIDNKLENAQVLSDQRLLRRALENLISNALKFSFKSSKINIFLKEENNKTVISIQDFGIGISTEDQANIFSKYGQTSSKPTNGEPSTGLGLTIVKRIMDELGGQVSFESELNVGSTFKLHL